MLDVELRENKMKEIRTQIKQFIVNNFLFGRGEDDLPPDASILEHGIIDPIGSMELVGFLEAIFGIDVDDMKLIPQNLDSVEWIVKFLATKQIE